MSSYGVGVFGIGWVAGEHIRAYMHSPHMKVMALATRRKQSAQAAREKLGLDCDIVDTFDDLLERNDIHVIDICSPNALHAEEAVSAAEAGKHCLIEKPITTTLEDAVRLQRSARERGLSLAVDHMMVENVYNHRARELIGRGAIGEVNDISLHMEFCYGSAPDEAASWRCADPKERGGPIGDVGSHCLYMAEFLLDSEVLSLACVYMPRTLDIAVENGAVVQFRLRSGVQGTVRVAFNQPRGGLGGTLSSNLGYEIYGAQGVIRGYGTLFQLSGHPGEPVEVRLELDDFRRTEKIRIDPVQNIYQAVIAKHAESIVNDTPLDAGDALHNLQLVLGCYESADRQGQTINF